jgi:hypothetical protein
MQSAGNLVNWIYSMIYLLPSLVMVAVAVTTQGGPRPGFLREAIGPESVILWGGQAKRYNERTKSMKVITWSFIIFLLISIAGSIRMLFV